MLPLSAGMSQLAPAWASFTSQLRPSMTSSPSLSQLLASPHFQNLLHNQVAALQSQQMSAAQNDAPAKSPRTPPSYTAPRKRVGGSTMKTAKVWRFFDELPTPEQAAECRICRKKIKATNSSTTGMIRHLRSCHVTEYQQVQEARQSSMLMKMEEKTKVQLLRDMSNERAPTKNEDAQKSPSALSSASDTASSSSSHFTPLMLPHGLPAPKPVKVHMKQDMTEVEEPAEHSTTTSAFASIPKKENLELDDESKKLNAQIALMLLMDQHTAQLVDRPGFRQLIRFLRPSHQLPFSSTFESELMPEIMNQIRQFGTMMLLNNPITNPIEALLPAPVVAAQPFPFAAACNKVETGKTDEDSDSTSTASSADSESPSQLAELVRILNGRASHDELLSLISICRNALAYFEERPALLSKLSMSLPTSEPSHPLRELRFAAQHVDSINAFIRATPDMELIPISEAQRRLLAELIN